MTTNESLLQKADLTIADLQATGGELQPEEAATFIRKLIKTPKLIRQCRVVEMTAPKRKINKIGFAKRILRKATSATALTEAQRSKPTTEQIELDTKEQIAERAATDLEELAINGDTDYVNGLDQDDEDYLSQVDGWLKNGEANGNVADVENATISKAVFKMGLKALPVQYQRNLAAMRHYVSVNNETEYRDTLADRGTALGDQMTTGRSPAFAYGSPVESVHWMPESKGIFTNPLNLIFGIQRQVSMEFDKDITARVYIIVLTARVDFKIEEAAALTVYENIASD